MSKSKQSTLAEAEVRKTDRPTGCEHTVIDGDTGNYRPCGISAHIVVMNSLERGNSYYCKTHAKDTWLEMVE